MTEPTDPDEYVRERLEGADRETLETIAEDDSELGELARRALVFLDQGAPAPAPEGGWPAGGGGATDHEDLAGLEDADELSADDRERLVDEVARRTSFTVDDLREQDDEFLLTLAESVDAIDVS